MLLTSLMFHDVLPDRQWHASGFPGTAADLYKIDGLEFRSHLKAISQTPAAQRVTVPEILKEKVTNGVLLTFDDGGASAIYIADLLEEFGWKGHFLITAGKLDCAGFVSRPQLQDLHRRGHIIGSHSFSHPLRFSSCTLPVMREEWARSCEMLRDALGSDVSVASVPGGGYSRQVAETAAEAGIRVLFNSEPVRRPTVVADCLVVGRYGAKRGYPPEWSSDLVAGRFSACAREFAFWNGKKLGKRILGSGWLQLRRYLLGDPH